MTTERSLEKASYLVGQASQAEDRGKGGENKKKRGEEGHLIRDHDALSVRFDRAIRSTSALRAAGSVRAGTSTYPPSTSCFILRRSSTKVHVRCRRRAPAAPMQLQCSVAAQSVD